MRTVLVVDDDTSFRLSLSEALVEYAGDFNTIACKNGREAVEVMRSVPVDVVVTDLKMPEMDGFALIAHISNKHSDVPVIVMTAHATTEARERLHAAGIFECFEKPIDFGDLVTAIFTSFKERSDGRIRGIYLPAFLQLVEMERKTCTLTITAGEAVGRLYFQEGRLIDAAQGQGRGEEAAYKIICWDNPEIEIENICRRKEQTITKNLGTLMLDAFRTMDEGQGEGYSVTALDDDLNEVNDTMEDEFAVTGDSTDTGDPPVVEIVENDDAEPVERLSAPEEVVTPPDNGDTNKTFVSREEEDMADTQEVLNVFINLDGVQAACLVGRDGFLLDSMTKAKVDTEMIGAIASAGFGSAESMGKQLGRGRMSLNMIEFENGPALLSPVGEDAFIVIVADNNANLGMIRLKLKKHVGELATAAFS